MQQENQELVHKLIGQEEALQYSSRSLEQRSTECQALNRQLEATLADVRQQVDNAYCSCSIESQVAERLGN